MEKTIARCALTLSLACTPVLSFAQTNVAQLLPPYAGQGDGVTSNILFVAGTREINLAMRPWGGTFLRSFGHARIEMQGSDSVQAIGRLLDTPSCIGMMSRPMRADEETVVRQGVGRAPLFLRVAADFVVVCVHKENPLMQTGISVEKLDAVFSKTRKSGAAEDVKTWGQLGLTETWVDKPIALYACARASVLTDFFVGSVLNGGEFKDSVQYTIRDGETADIVSSNRYAIGFSSLRVCGDAVALAPVSAGQGNAPVQPVAANVAAYPLTRYVYAYLALKPGQAIDGSRREFMKVMLSKEGQAAAAQAGYVPVSFEFAKGELAKIGVALAPAPSKSPR